MTGLAGINFQSAAQQLRVLGLAMICMGTWLANFEFSFLQSLAKDV